MSAVLVGRFLGVAGGSFAAVVAVVARGTEMAGMEVDTLDCEFDEEVDDEDEEVDEEVGADEVEEVEEEVGIVEDVAVVEEEEEEGIGEEEGVEA